ncbi:MAG: hypothetical protein JXB85_00675 [Anaerolineales bacterium]|nr:hypothetical protein [Anaerolineales bacterium]
MDKYSKAVQRSLRAHVRDAYAREWHRELTKRDESFAEWRNGEISSGELSHRIHLYEMGPSRELFKRYDGGDDAILLAYAIVTGLIDREQVSAEVLETIQGPLSFYQSLKEHGDLLRPGE